MPGKKRLIWQIFPFFLLIIVISLVAVIGYASISVKHFFLEQAKADLEARARLFEGQVLGFLEPLDAKRIDLLCKNVGQSSSTRITIIHPSGKVVGDSESDPRRMDNHADRPEFIDAVRGALGTSVRYSRTIGKDLMYVGLPVRKDNDLLAVVRMSIPVDGMDKAIKEIQGKIVAGGVIVALLSAAISLIVARRISQPIEELKKGAEYFSRGDFQYRMPVSRIQEIGSLYEAIKDMARELHERINTIMRQRNEIEAILSSMVEGVIAVDTEERVIRMNSAAAMMLGCDSGRVQGRSIQEAVRNSIFQKFVSEALASPSPVEKEMELSSGEERFVNGHGTVLRDAEGNRIGALVVLNNITRLRVLENIRKEFVANVSHEIKTPITAIKGFVETLSGGGVKDHKDTKRFLEIISKHVNRLEAIIDDLLSLSRIEKDAETGEIQLKEAGIKEVLDTAVQVCQPIAEAKGIHIEVLCDESYAARINPPLLEQAVVNLLDNAVKYSDENSVVRLEANLDDKEVIMAIIDKGRGIEKEHLPRLFERFYRVDRARSRRLGGTGLGLAIVKHIVQAHKGRILVESSPGKGSTFSIHLPRV